MLPSSQPESAELVDRLKAGDSAAFSQVVDTLGPRMLAVARRMLRQEQDAQDAVQDAFLSAFKALATFDGRSQLSTWLHRITVNVCLMRLRTRRRKPEQPIETLLPTFLSDGHQTRRTPSWPGDPLGALGDQERSEQVRVMVAQLPEPFRVVLLLRDVEELSTSDTAAALGISENAVKTRLHRARQALRTLIEESMPDLTGSRS